MYTHFQSPGEIHHQLQINKYYYDQNNEGNNKYRFGLQKGGAALKFSPSSSHIVILTFTNSQRISKTRFAVKLKTPLFSFFFIFSLSSDGSCQDCLQGHVLEIGLNMKGEEREVRLGKKKQIRPGSYSELNKRLTAWQVPPLPVTVTWRAASLSPLSSV